MGCGASVQPSDTARNSLLSSRPNDENRRELFPASSLMASLQACPPTSNVPGVVHPNAAVHIVRISDGGVFRKEEPTKIESDDIIEFRVEGKNRYDIQQVFKNGNDFFAVPNGYEFRNLSRETPVEEARLILSFALIEPTMDLYFSVTRSSTKEGSSVEQKYSRENCEANRVIISKPQFKFILTDAQENQKVTMHKGDKLEIEWSSKNGIGYRIEEKRFCPISGGFYTVEQASSDHGVAPTAPKGKFSKICNEFGTSFFVRFTENNQLHDISVCVVNDRYKIQRVKFTETKIEPNLVYIEQTDFVAFEWNTKRKQTFVQIDPFRIAGKPPKSIELKRKDENFFWPLEPSRAGLAYYQFNQVGIYCFKSDNDQIGTIIVEPRKIIHQIPVFADQFVYKIDTKDLIQFVWNTTDTAENPVYFQIDSNSSVVPDDANGLQGIFDCAGHRCGRADSHLRHFLSNSEVYLFNIPKHGLYHFSCSEKTNIPLISVIVENGIDNHHVNYNENGVFDIATIIINRSDQVWFHSSSDLVASIYQTDEHGRQRELSQRIFQAQRNSINYFMKQFPQLGVFYFTTSFSQGKQQQMDDGSSAVLAVIVIPDITFHYRMIEKSHFDSHPIMTGINDFVIWQFPHPISQNVVQLRSDATMQDLRSCHERAIVGRHRQCLAVECVQTGAYFFANPEFERIAGAEESRLISTIVIDPPFGEHCFIVNNREFLPNYLYLEQNETVSWTFAYEGHHRITINLKDNPLAVEEVETKRFQTPHVYREINHFINGVNFLHTFHRPGVYTVGCSAFAEEATVVVYSKEESRQQRKRVQAPEFRSDLDLLSEFGTRVNLSCANRAAQIYYTLDGSLPTRYFNHVQLYDPNEGILLSEPGLQLIRAYAIEDQKIASAIITSSATYVVQNRELEVMNELRAAWNSSEISLLSELEEPNKVYNTIKVEPISSTDLIDHYELLINGVAQRIQIPAHDVHFSAEGFAAGEQYEMVVIAYPRADILDAEPIASNKRAFEIKRESSTGGPLVSLSVSDDQSSVIIIWAHIGDHVDQYIVYVNNIETKPINKEDFQDLFGIQFLGLQHQQKYFFHVDARIKNGGTRKSNVVVVELPLEMPIKQILAKQYVPYITINNERAPSNIPLQSINLTQLPFQPRENDREIEKIPITHVFRSAVPAISYIRNPNGITLHWPQPSAAVADFVENYRIMIDDEQYGPLITSREELKFQINLEPGRHQCSVDLIPKDKNQKVYSSNVLNIDIQTPSNNIRQEPKQQREPSNIPIHNAVELKDLPIPKLNVQMINSTSIRVKWHLDRAMPKDAYVAFYEVHIRGENFLDSIKSVEKIEERGYIEHIWRLNETFLEVQGISDRSEYTIFVRTFFHVTGVTDMTYLSTNSKETTTARIDPMIDLVTRPLLKVDRFGNQSAVLSWKLDDSVDQNLVKGYRLVLNSKPTEILPPSQRDYELKNLKPGTTNDVQVSVTTNPDFVDEKISEAIRIVCPQRPTPPEIRSIRPEKPFSIAIQWNFNSQDQDEVTSFKIFLNSKIHGEIDTEGRQTFKYEFNKLEANQEYSILVKSFIGERKLDGYAHQCSIESKASNELILKCVAPPRGTTPRIERMNSKGVELVWDPPAEENDLKLTGYQILKDGRAIGKLLKADQRRLSINDLDVGNRYSFQVVPITDQLGGTPLRTGEQYDANRHGHFLPGPKLEVDFTDLVQLPERFWVENVSGRGAMICWSPIHSSSSSNRQPDSYKLLVWNNIDIKREDPKVVSLEKDRTNVLLKDLLSNTIYEIQLQAVKRRNQSKSSETFNVSSNSEVISFQTGAPPEPPSQMHLIACTNTAARIAFDPFIEHKAEIITLRVHAKATSSQSNAREISLDLTPDSTEFLLSNLVEKSEYQATIYAITEEYLNEINCREVSQLRKELKPSDWLTKSELTFHTAGCEPASEITVQKATTDLIKLQWKLPRVYGSTELIGQILRWKLEQGEENEKQLKPRDTGATISGPLPSGVYRISLASVFTMKINLEPTDDETSRREFRLETETTVPVRYSLLNSCDKPELYLSGYTQKTVDLTWNKPDMFTVIKHPEKIDEQIRIHRRLVDYRVDIVEETSQSKGGKTSTTIIDGRQRCTLTECEPEKIYEVQVVARTQVFNEFLDETNINTNIDHDETQETPSKTLFVQTLKKKDLLRSLKAEFFFRGPKSEEETPLNGKTEISPLGYIKVDWEMGNTKDIAHLILQWNSAKDLRVFQQILKNEKNSFTIDQFDEKHPCVIDLTIVTHENVRTKYPSLTIPVPGPPDAPKVWLMKTTNTTFVVEWSEPKSYGIPIIGFQLFVAGKKAGDVIQKNWRRAEIPSYINRTYQVNVCAVTNHPERPYSAMSETLTVITTPTTNLVPTMSYHNDDGHSMSFDSTIARIIPVQIESINEDKLHVEWSSFLPTSAVRGYYVHYTCLNTGDVQVMKVAKRARQAVLRGLRPGFTYGIMVLAVDKNGGILYTSDKSTFQMNAPPNAPIVAISERDNDHVKVEWRPAATYGDLTIEGYKVFVNNRLAAILAHNQLTYTLTNGIPCENYIVHVQALSNDKNIVSPTSRSIQFSWPGIRPGAFRRVDDGQTGAIVLAWEHPQLEDQTEKLIGFKLFSENLTTHAFHLLGEYDAGTHQTTIYNLNNGKYRLWLEIQSEKYSARARPISINVGRFNTLMNRPAAFDSNKSPMKKNNRFRSPTTLSTLPPLRSIKYS